MYTTKFHSFLNFFLFFFSPSLSSFHSISWPGTCSVEPVYPLSHSTPAPALSSPGFDEHFYPQHILVACFLFSYVSFFITFICVHGEEHVMSPCGGQGTTWAMYLFLSFYCVDLRVWWKAIRLCVAHSGLLLLPGSLACATMLNLHYILSVSAGDNTQGLQCGKHMLYYWATRSTACTSLFIKPGILCCWSAASEMNMCLAYMSPSVLNLEYRLSKSLISVTNGLLPSTWKMREETQEFKVIFPLCRKF